MDDEATEPEGITGSQVGGGMVEGVHKLVDDAGDHMLRNSKPVTRFLLKRVPGAPALVYDISQLATSPNKTRMAFGLAGGLIGGAAGGALGGAAGGVNAPIGAALGSTFGEGLGEQIYDDHAAAIDHAVEHPGEAAQDMLRATRDWITNRQRQLGQRR